MSSLNPQRQKAVGAGVGLVLVGWGAWDLGLFGRIIRFFRWALEMLGDAQTAAGLGDVILPLLLICLGSASIIWGFGGLDWLKKQRTVGPKRIPLIDVRNRAVETGWVFDGETLHCLEFMDALRQAGLDKTLQFWGRRTQSISSVTKLYPLEKISECHWEDYQIDGLRMIAMEDNFDIVSANVTSGTEGGFSDIHVSSKKVFRWLRNDAEQFKGKR